MSRGKPGRKVFLVCAVLAGLGILLSFLDRPEDPALINSQSSEQTLSNPADADIATASLLSADDIADAAESANNEILVCPTPERKLPTPESWIRGFDQASDFHVRLVINLSDSTDGETKLMAELLSPASDPNAHIDTLYRIASDNPQSPLAALHLLSACAAKPSHPSCGDSLIENVIDLDGDNGLTWAVIASVELQRDNTEGAVTALENAVNAPIYDDYTRRHLSLIKDYLPIVVGTNMVNSFGQALGISTSVNLTGKYYQSLIGFCSVQAQSNASLADACLAFGRRLQTESSNLLNSLIGVALQESSLLALGETDAAAAVSAEHTIAREVLVNIDTQRAFNLLNYDDELASNWFAELVANGEAAAIVNLVAEAKSLSADPAYNPCFAR